MRPAGMFVSKKTEGYLRELYRKKEADKKIRILAKEKSKLFGVIFGISLIAAIPVFVSDHSLASVPVRILERNEYGDGERQVGLIVRTDSGRSRKVTVTVRPRRYTDEELLKFSEDLDEMLDEMILGGNRSTDCITEDLMLPAKVEGFPFEITWKSDRPLILNAKGEINKERLSQEDEEGKGINVRLCATLKYDDYSEDKYMYTVLYKTVAETGGSGLPDIEGQIRTKDEESNTDHEQILPDEAGGDRVTFYRDDVNRGWFVLIIGLALAVFAAERKSGRIRDEADNRRRQTEADIYRILNQYALYYTAGMNPRAIWGAICAGYERSTERLKGEKRYAYEEMIVTKKMMDEGVEETAAYDDFSRRMQSMGYRSFISLIKQTAVKGSAGLDDLLMKEMERSQRERINRVKEEASRAQTKLLLPMFMMLIVVIAILMIPAFCSLNT